MYMESRTFLRQVPKSQVKLQVPSGLTLQYLDCLFLKLLSSEHPPSLPLTPSPPVTGRRYPGPTIRLIEKSHPISTKAYAQGLIGQISKFAKTC